jgi:SAM-dependent methyltransferase
MSQITQELTIAKPVEDCGCAPGCCDDTPTTNKAVNEDHIRQQVRAHYGGIIDKKEEGEECCAPGCCGDTAADQKVDYGKMLDYTAEELASVPEASNYGLGCGNPILAAKLQPGEVVVDLGSGAGIDIFLSSKQLGPTGRAIGVDMTPTMITKARSNAAEHGFTNVEFRLGEIENLPVADGTVDAIISNCVVNLSPNKEQVFRECLRVLKPGGRIAISDIVATAKFPEELKDDPALYCGCMSGASLMDELKALLSRIGFENVEINPKDNSREIIKEWAPNTSIEDVLCSAYILAVKP